MSDAAEAPKKKKPIVPIIMILIVLLGGGFFMMKSKGGSKAKPAIVISDKETELEEFLTNTEDQASYVRAKMSVRLAKDYDEAKVKANMGDLRDAVLTVFNNTLSKDVMDPTKRKQLKKKLAAAMNEALIASAPADPEADGKKKKKKKKASEDSDDEPVNPDWDSQTGPVLEVRFSSLATQ